MGFTNLLDRLQAKLEILRLEKRYTRGRNRRSTFVSNAVYVDGEYIYNTPNTTGSSTASSSSPPATHHDAEPTKKQKTRWSTSNMPAFGIASTSTSPPCPPAKKRSISHM